ncbi:hypothetical protein [Pedobacter montanisoli]|uniref:DUF4890 domain-containing protein n=1 Tax=Pedobacter montanisoli TaxID=2923277 RepID=A0ABS9ZW84_9SPHI|nr:hypothetical protein [Pedobacter montanisoli]MCJ0742557.1 hypothetical protein [Pedobacter montanisoli]
MKKLLLICTFIFGVIAFANAQQGGGRMGGNMGRMDPEARVKQLDEKLKLSDDQKTKVLAIFKDQGEAQKKMMEEAQNGGDRSAMREKMQKMREEYDAKLNGVLNEDQKKAYKAWQDEQRAEMQKRMQERGGQ